MRDRKQRSSYAYNRIDVPSKYIFTCFYCGEPAEDDEHFPPISRYHDYMSLYNSHPPLIVPSCRSCNELLGITLQENIYQRAVDVKKMIIRKAGKYVSLGDLWEEDDIEYLGFTGNYKAMLESVPTVAHYWNRRIGWQHWPVSIDGEPIEIEDDIIGLKVGSKSFTSIDTLYEYARRVDKIPIKYLELVIGLTGIKRVEYAYNFCKTVKVRSEAEMKRVLEDLKESLEDGN